MQYLTSFHAEIDYGTDGHKKVNIHKSYDEALQTIQNFPLKPTITVHSGGGFHLYWILQEPLKVSDYGIDSLEFINRDLCRLLNADRGTQDITRVLRLPGTYNLKDPDNPRPVTIVEQSDREYSYDEIRAFLDTQPPDDNGIYPRPKPVPKEPDGSAMKPLPMTGNLTEEDIQALPISDKTKQLILKGNDGSYPSRSEADFACILELLRTDVPESTIAAIFQQYPIGEKYREPNNGIRYLSRTMDKAFQTLEEEQEGFLVKSGSIRKDKSGNLAINPYTFQQHLFTEYNIVYMRSGKSFYQYKNGLYNQIDDDSLNCLCHEILDGQSFLLSPNTFKDIIHHGKGSTPRNADKDQNRYLTFQNCIYDMEADTFHPHSPKFFSTRSVNYAYDPNAECPRFRQFLDEIFENDLERINFIQLAMGYLFHPMITDPILFIFYGNGANGKSVLLQVFRHLVGEMNVSEVKLNELKNDQYRMLLKGKMLNIDYEISQQHISDTSFIKTLVSGEPVTAKRLYNNPETFLPVCKFFFATNEQLRYSDSSLGMDRRLAVIPFNRKFEKYEQQPDLLATLLSELAGIFNFAHNGLHELRKCGYKFPEPNFLKMNTNGVINDFEIFNDFVKENVKITDNVLGIRYTPIYEAYEDYCKHRNTQPFSKIKFSKSLVKLGFYTEGSDVMSNVKYIHSVANIRESN